MEGGRGGGREGGREGEREGGREGDRQTVGRRKGVGMGRKEERNGVSREMAVEI